MDLESDQDWFQHEWMVCSSSVSPKEIWSCWSFEGSSVLGELYLWSHWFQGLQKRMEDTFLCSTWRYWWIVLWRPLPLSSACPWWNGRSNGREDQTETEFNGDFQGKFQGCENQTIMPFKNNLWCDSDIALPLQTNNRKPWSICLLQINRKEILSVLTGQRDTKRIGK